MIAHAFASSGTATISISGRSEDTLLEKKSKTSERFLNAILFSHVSNFIDKNTVAHLIEGIKSTVGTIDILVTNAGYSPELLLMEEPDLRTGTAGWKSTYDEILALLS